jgi:hypothetical protein
MKFPWIYTFIGAYSIETGHRESLFAMEARACLKPIIHWDIHAFRSLAPHKVDRHNPRSASQWNGTGEFSEDVKSIVASIAQQRTKDNRIPMDYNWTPQIENKIISLSPATCSITPYPACPLPINPGLRSQFCLH